GTCNTRSGSLIPCAQQDPTVCASDDNFAVISGMVCGGSGSSDAFGCMGAFCSCGQATICAMNRSTDAEVLFRSAPIPIRWAWCCGQCPMDLACAELDPATCAARGDGTVITGTVCSSMMSIEAGCRTSDAGCGDLPTCAIDPATMGEVMFPDTCVPDGWAMC